MRILLVNPNRYRTPPTPPLGLSHLLSGLGDSRHEGRIVDLCFEDDPASSLDREIEKFKPHVAGFTIRNIDTCICDNNVFFLDDIRELVTRVKAHGIPVIAGGAGFSFSPRAILAYLGADYGVSGPGERALVRFLDLFSSDTPPPGTILNGWETGIAPDFTVDRNDTIDYARYTADRGLLGFETKKGCAEGCSYCMERKKKLIFRSPDAIVRELAELAERGFTSFHLCDTEFNQDLGHCTAFLETLIHKGPSISWVLYMKSFPYSEELFRLLKKSGADLVTLSMPTGGNALEHAETICRIARLYDIKLAIDLLLGFPGESREDSRRTIEKLRTIRPDTVGIMSTFRLYPELPLTRIITGSPEHRKHLKGALDHNPDYILPVFYNHLSLEILRELIDDDPLFKIEGFERTSNYERL